jgi:SAM-dependent methyltransferase
MSQREIISMPVCPLCASLDSIAEAEIDTTTVRNYWRKFDYDLAADFPDLPATIVQHRCTQCTLHWFTPTLVGPPGLYERLGDWPPYYRARAWEWDVTIDILREAAVQDVLEVGSGRGNFLDLASRSIARCEGLEFNPEALAASRARGHSVSDLALEDVAGDRSAIVAFQLLEHLGNPRIFLDSAVSKLKMGGLLIVAVPNQDGFTGALHGNFLNLPPHHATLWQKSCFAAVAGQLNLDLVAYHCEPIRLVQFKLYLMRSLRPAHNIFGKMYNLVYRLLIHAIGPAIFYAPGPLPAGEAHLAVFRKSR